jgi:archaellum component FlaC
MSTPQIETKIERVVESIESLTNAVVTLREKADDDRAHAMQEVTDAREEAKEALRAFLQPTLRIASAA